MIVQADEYERSGGHVLQEFFDSTATAFKHKEVISWAEALRLDRDERRKEEEKMSSSKDNSSV